MGKLKITPGGGGADLDVVTAGAGDVLAGKVIVDKEGEPLVGSIPGRSAATITPSTANQIINAGQYLSGAQTILGDPNLQAANIKKGMTIFGKTGNFQGYVDSPLYLYNNGAWGGGQSGGSFAGTNISPENVVMSNYIQYCGRGDLILFRLNNSFDLSGYKYIKMVLEAIVNIDSNGQYTNASIKIKSGSNFSSTDVASVFSGTMSSKGLNTVVIDISSLNGFYWLFFSGGNQFGPNSQNFYIKTAIRQIYLTNI